MSDLSDWETNEHDTPIRVSKQNKWDDEDVEEDDVKENWEESSDDEKEKAKTTTTPTTSAAPSKKKSAAQRAIAKREKMNINDDNEEEDDSERKRRERQAIIEADLENTKGMFQGIAIKEAEVDKVNSNNAGSLSRDVTAKVSLLDKINPKSKEEFDKFSKLLVERIQKHEKNSLYVNFISEFVRELCLPLKDLDVRKISTSLATLANEKQKQMKEKEKPKKKGNTKPTLQVESLDSMIAYGNEYYDDEYEDDFM